MAKKTIGSLKSHFKTRNRALAREVETLKRRLDAAVRGQAAEKWAIPW